MILRRRTTNAPRAGRLLAMTGGAAILALSACAPAPSSPKVAVGANCSVPASTPAPTLINRVFSCELRKAGVPERTIAKAVREADGVAWCESRHRTQAVAYGGRYLYTPNPATGYKYSAAGLFQIIRSTANAYLPGGYAKVHDPVANTRGAATIWLWGYKRHRNPWAPWSCAPGTSAYAGAARQR